MKALHISEAGRVSKEVKILSERTLKRKASEVSKREAQNFVYGHEDLILGASAKEIDHAVSKIWKALRDLRFAKIYAETANRGKGELVGQ